MKVMKCLRKDFKSINEAEEAYNINYFHKEVLSMYVCMYKLYFNTEILSLHK